MLLTTDVWAVSAESESWVQEEDSVPLRQGVQPPSTLSELQYQSVAGVCHQGNIFCPFSMEHLPENPEDGVPLKNNSKKRYIMGL